MRARWWCKVCRSWGRGGPEAWVKHHEREHREGTGAGSNVSFGFTGDQPITDKWRNGAPGKPVWLEAREP